MEPTAILRPGLKMKTHFCPVHASLAAHPAALGYKKMDLPESIEIQVHDKSRRPVEGIIIEVKVKSGTKNPYIILSPKTDSDGKTTITKQDFIGQFKDHWEMGLMDYNGTIESANQNVELYLYNPSWAIENKHLCMAWPLLKNEISLWSSRAEKYDYLISCVNPKYKAKKAVVDIEKTNLITVEVAKKWFKA